MAAGGANAADLAAAFQKLIAALSACFQRDRSDGNTAVQQLTEAQQGLLYTCDLLQHRLTVALNELKMEGGAGVSKPETQAGSSEIMDPAICCIAMAQETKVFVEKLNALASQAAPSHAGTLQL